MSIPTNIAEGAGRDSELEFARFLSIAIGSANEVESLLVVASRLGLGEPTSIAEASVAIEKLRRRLITLHRVVSVRARRI